MNRPKSIFRRAAEGGVTLGVLFICIFLLETIAGPMTGLIAIALMVYVPVHVYRKVKATYSAAHGLSTFSALWLEGILLFVCASIILALGSFIFLRLLVPGYLPALTAQAADFIAGNPQLLDSGTEPQQLARYFASIRPIDISMTLMWSAAFTGSIASLVIAAIVKSLRVPPAAPKN